jgi:DNA-binding transcriptional ArsR family regulator
MPGWCAGRAASARPSAKRATKVEFVPKSPEELLAVATLFPSLGHPGRLSLLGFIAGGERSGTQCVAHLGLAQGRASAHLARLVQSGLVSKRRAERRVYYEIADRRGPRAPGADDQPIYRSRRDIHLG